ncbi:DUF3566 domain-containing protein [Pseudonocardia parietis]|uniref:DUF3566 domain-containing protein n=1 Tax=Pseudonocardia parietis TaxID=570936 RepID=A0ABS4VLP0_9PSEU|nr:DUF3566 domain-containing protein [Pseudonocardia parietis]MBP2364827.1 hypothetical protein [Pseudonocardia parietis]
MSTDDRTPSRDEGRTVATDADEATDTTPPPAASDVPPSPTPRAVEPAAEEPVADPAGASPPPWRRVPDAQDGAHDADRPTVADSLLSEAPTAFLTAPGAGAAAGGATATAVREPEQRETGAETPRAAVRNRPPRQALLQLKRLDPWSVLKMALALSVVLWLVWMVAAGVLYGVLGGMGVWDRLNGTYADLVTGQQATGGTLISAGRVFGLAAVVGAVNSLLFAVAMTIVAFVYNVAADLVGGVEVTLSERD